MGASPEVGDGGSWYPAALGARDDGSGTSQGNEHPQPRAPASLTLRPAPS